MYPPPIPDHLFLTVFEKSGYAMLLNAAEFTVVAVSDKYLEILNTNRELITGKNITDVISTDDISRVTDALGEAVSGETVSYEDGEWLITDQPIVAEGQVSYIIHTLTPLPTTATATPPQQSDALFRNLVLQAPVAISLLRGEQLLVETANGQMLQIWGKTDRIIGMPLQQALPELEGQPFLQMLKNVLHTGEPYYGYETMANLERNGRIDPYYFNFVYYPLEEGGVYNSVMVLANEVTEQVKARAALEESERQFRNMVAQAPVAIGIMRSREMVIEMYNQELLKIWGREEHEVNGQKLLDVFPELRDQQFPELLMQVYDTGVPYQAQEASALVQTNKGLIKYWFDFSYEPLFEIDGSVSGIIVMVYNITEKVEAKHKLEVAEERLRLATEATGLGTYDLNLKTNHIVYSARLAEIFGFSNDKDISHNKLRSMVHPNDIHVVNEAYERALVTDVYFYEARIIWEDGTQHWIRTQGNVILDDKGLPDRLVGTVLDVTSQRHIINELRNSEENLRLATEAAELGTFDWNIPEDKLQWDNRCRELFGIFNNEPVAYGSTFVNGLHPDDRDRVLETVNASLNKRFTGGNYDVDYRTIGVEDGQLRWVRAKGKAFFNDKDQPTRLIGTIIDVTDSKLDEIRKNDFIAMASHELKTPLTSLKAYIQMLLAKARKSDDQFFSNSLEKADNQVDKMTKLIYGFLDLSKIESGKLNLETQHFDINDAVNEAIADTRPIAQSHRIIFEPDGKPFVNADREKISQVIINFINNAVKYSPKGTDVYVSVKEIDGWVEVAVKDSGIGIKSYDLEKIFQRFYRVQDEKMKGFSGFGIGLYLSHEIITLHKGKIGASSTQGEGSTFYFRLPKAV